MASSIASTSNLSTTTNSTNQFTNYRSNLKNSLTDLVKTLSEQRNNNEQLSGRSLDSKFLVEQVELVMEKSKISFKSVNGLEEVAGEAEEEVYKSQVKKSSVDKALELMLFDVVLNPRDLNAQISKYGLLTDLLDVVLTFAEKDYADSNLPLQCISGVLDLQTIAGCHHIFDYVESRRDRLTKNMNPQSGKGPLLLRLLNELLRRLPKSKTTDVIFSGRILMFLSSVFPLAEKSGVNLRGNFNSGKETLFEDMSKMEMDLPLEDADAMEVDGKKSQEDEAAAEARVFYTTFWSLQTYFNNPPALFVPPTSTSSSEDPFDLLRNGLSKTLDAFARATAKEKRLLGAGTGNLKGGVRKVDENVSLVDEEAVKEHYFFPKFLTSPNLLELEIADSSFRRQILVQMMILFQYLLSFTPEARARDQLILTNPPARLNHTLLPAHEKWIRELRVKTLMEMESMQVGKPFRNTVELILLREQNWINWKLKSCLPYEKPPLDSISKSKLVRQKLINVTRKPKKFPYELGNSTLASLWRKNLISLDNFEVEPSKESFDQLFRDWRKSKKFVESKNELLKALESDSKPDVSKIGALKNELEEGEKKLTALHWRAIRIASTTHLHLFPVIKDGNLELLVSAMENEIRIKEEAEVSAALEPELKEEETIEDELPTETLVITVKPEEAEEQHHVHAVLISSPTPRLSQVTTGNEVIDTVTDLGTPIATSTSTITSNYISTSEIVNSIIPHASDDDLIKIGETDPTANKVAVVAVVEPGTPKRLREGEMEDGIEKEDEDEQVAKRLKLDEDIEMAELEVPKN